MANLPFPSIFNSFSDARFDYVLRQNFLSSSLISIIESVLVLTKWNNSNYSSVSNIIFNTFFENNPIFRYAFVEEAGFGKSSWWSADKSSDVLSWEVVGSSPVRDMLFALINFHIFLRILNVSRIFWNFLLYNQLLLYHQLICDPRIREGIF